MEIPAGVIEERIGRIEYSDDEGYGIHPIGTQRLLVLIWSFEAGKSSGRLEIGGLFRHYSTLFVESMRDNPDSMTLERFALRFSADVGSLLERTALSHRYDRVSVNAILLDLQSKEAQECIFGVEQIAYTGNAKVERELLLELNGVLRLDRLVYRERRRMFTSSNFAWLLSHDQRLRDFVPHFSRSGFIDEYLAQKRSHGLGLARILSDGRLPEDFTGIAVMFDSAQPSKKNAA
jgi:hypothetical protein